MVDLPIDINISNRRRSIAISVVEGRISVKAPKYVSRVDIDRLISQKRTWIEKQLTKSNVLAHEASKRFYTSGGEILFLGKSYILQLSEHPWVSLCLDGPLLRIYSPKSSPTKIKRIIHDWLKNKAHKRFQQKTLHFASKLGVSFNEICMRRYLRRWGSCSSTGKLSYNWLLIQAEEAVIDYVVCHEVSHLLHMNHSRAFWSCVESLCPDYRIRRKWLRDHGDTLTLI